MRLRPVGECQVYRRDGLCSPIVFANAVPLKLSHTKLSNIYCINANFCIPVSLDDEGVFPVDFVNDCLYLVVELSNLFIVVIRCVGIDWMIVMLSSLLSREW